MRRGQGIYLSTLIGHLSSTIIYYRMLIEYIPSLHAIFPRLIFFIFAFSIPYFSLALIIGYMDYKRGSVGVDSALGALASPVTMDSMMASIYAQRGLLEHTMGNDEKAKEYLEKSISILMRWCRKDV